MVAIISGYSIVTGFVVAEIRLYDLNYYLRDSSLGQHVQLAAFLSIVWQMHVRTHNVCVCAARIASQHASHLCRAAEATLQVCFHVLVPAKAFDGRSGGRHRSALILFVVATAALCFTRERRQCFEAHTCGSLHPTLTRGVPGVWLIDMVYAKNGLDDRCCKT